jgi:hypothetical protein
MGNTNFSIILPRLLFTRSHGAELVARAIRRRLGIDGCGVNGRNDVVIRDGEREFKMSCSFCSTRKMLTGRTSLGRRTRLYSTELIIMGRCSSRQILLISGNHSSPRRYVCLLLPSRRCRTSDDPVRICHKAMETINQIADPPSQICRRKE